MLSGKIGQAKRCPFFLEDLELARVALSCHTALDVLCLKMHEARLLGCRCQRGPLSQQEKPFSPWTGCDKKEEGCGERK